MDICACCAPHVKQTGEIGLIKIVKVLKFNGGMRLFIACGSGALEVLEMQAPGSLVNFRDIYVHELQ